MSYENEEAGGAVPATTQEVVRRRTVESGRICRECGGRSRMRSWVRHLHELPEGARFTVAGGKPDDPDTMGEFRVIEQSPASVRVAPVVAKRTTRTFTPRFGEKPVTFESELRGWQRMAPTTQVVTSAAGATLALVPNNSSSDEA